MRAHILLDTVPVLGCALILAVAAEAQELTITRPSNSAVSQQVSHLPKAAEHAQKVPHVRHQVPFHPGQSAATTFDAVVQSSPGPLVTSTSGVHFDALSADGYSPPDANIAVGPNHVVEAINLQYAIYNKSGALVLGPKDLSALWAPLLGSCANGSGSDPVVQYDRLADRWLITQMASTSTSNPFAECVAVSQTSDPAGAYYLYSYPRTALNDYPKFGVWPTSTNSAYLATYNVYTVGSADNIYSFAGGQLCAYDRSAMLAGAKSPAEICFMISNDGGYLPSDLDGATPPLDGTPGLFLNLQSLSTLRLYNLSPNFASPASSSLKSMMPDLPVNSFNQACGGGGCIPEAGSLGTALDSLGDRLMYRLAFRMFPDHESVVVNHSVSAGTAVGVRWYELRSPVSSNGVGFSLYQNGTYAPDTTYRWMGSAAMDQAGDIAIGYSASSKAIHPGIRWAGRTPTLPLGTMGAESSIVDSLSSQINLAHWGDYSSLRIDPSDDCTFWFASEYLLDGLYFSDGYYNDNSWSTHVGSFKFPACGASASPDFSLSSSPSTIAVQEGQTGTSTITVNSIASFTGSVALSISGCPNAGCTLSQSQVVAPGSSTLTVTTTSVQPGTCSLTVTGLSGALSHTTSVLLTIPAPDFKISVNDTSMTIQPGQTGTTTVSVNSVNGLNSAVTLTTPGCPAGLTCSVTPNSITPTNGTASATLSIATSAQTTPGNYTVVVSGSDRTNTHTASVAVTVPAADFTISATPPTITVQPGQSGNSTIIVKETGMNSPVALACSVSPAAGTCSLPATITPTNGTASATMTFTAGSTQAPGNYLVTITATANGITHTTSVYITVPQPDFNIALSTATLAVTRGSHNSLTVSVTGPSGIGVSFSASGLPPGTSATFNPASVTTGSTSGSSIMTVSPSRFSPRGTYTVTVTGKGSNGSSHSAQFSLTVN